MTARLENGPPALSRLAYLKPLAAGGATLHCLRGNACVLYHAGVCMSCGRHESNGTNGIDRSRAVLQTAAGPNSSDGLDLSATRSYLRDISVTAPQQTIDI